MGYLDNTGTSWVASKLKEQLDTKADSSHTHERVNGLKPVVSSTVPTTNDNTIITFVKTS